MRFTVLLLIAVKKTMNVETTDAAAIYSLIKVNDHRVVCEP